jgi:hypothetical protein
MSLHCELSLENELEQEVGIMIFFRFYSLTWCVLFKKKKKTVILYAFMSSMYNVRGLIFHFWDEYQIFST